MTAGLGSGGAGPVPVTDGVRTGTIHGSGAETGETGSRVAAMTSEAATVSVAATTTREERNGGVGIATSTGTSVAMTARGVSAVPGGTIRNIRTVAATTSVAATTIVGPARRAATSVNPATSTPSNRIR